MTIELKLMDPLAARPLRSCTVCGKRTGKLRCEILWEGHDQSGEIRVCESCCLPDIDAKLQQRATELTDEAAKLRSLVGQIEEPSLADWEAANDARGVWAEVEYEAMRAEWEREQKGE